MENKNLYKECLDIYKNNLFLKKFDVGFPHGNNIADLELIIAIATHFEEYYQMETLSLNINDKYYICPEIKSIDDLKHFQSLIKNIALEKNQFGYSKFLFLYMENIKELNSIYAIIRNHFSNFCLSDYIFHKNLNENNGLFELTDNEYREILGIDSKWFDILHESAAYEYKHLEIYENKNLFDFHELDGKIRFSNYYKCRCFFIKGLIDSANDNFLKNKYYKEAFRDDNSMPSLVPLNRQNVYSRLLDDSNNYPKLLSRFIGMDYSDFWTMIPTINQLKELKYSYDDYYANLNYSINFDELNMCYREKGHFYIDSDHYELKDELYDF